MVIVIPAEAGIQVFKDLLDTGFRRYDDPGVCVTAMSLTYYIPRNWKADLNWFIPAFENRMRD